MRTDSFFHLTISDGCAPYLPDPQDPLVQIFHDYHGKVCAYAYQASGDYWLFFPYVAIYRIPSESNVISAYPEPMSNPNKIRDIYSRVVFPIALHTHGTQVLHASAVLAHHGVTAFCAMSETGKSTTVHALAQRGYLQWADDCVPFVITDDHVEAIPMEFQARIDSEAAKHLGTQWKIAKDHLAGAEPVAISRVIVLHRVSTKMERLVAVKQLNRAEAFRSVLLHAHFFNLAYPELKKKMVSAYMKLTTLLPVFEIHFQPGFDKLNVLLDEIEKILSGNPQLK